MAPHNKNPFENALEDIEFGNVDGMHCHTIHPLVIEFLKTLPEEDMGTIWSKLLPEYEEHFRWCLGTELLDNVMDEVQPMALFDEDGDQLTLLTLEGHYLYKLLVAAITLGFLAKAHMEKEDGQEK